MWAAAGSGAAGKACLPGSAVGQLYKMRGNEGTSLEGPVRLQ